ncbi:MAG: DUF1127 domain-containing protein [Gammaproteobacteria bacterium]|nr:DUF1127 domain-containing protein [Gammaproteobacteria bacterium]
MSTRTMTVRPTYTMVIPRGTQRSATHATGSRDRRPTPAGQRRHAPLATHAAADFSVARFILAAVSDVHDLVLASVDTWRRGRAIARTIAELSRLDDHVLRDVGIRRSEIRVVARSLVEHPGVDVRVRVGI